jgi:mevalonate pyrophosphate decarboxylase
VDVAKELAAMRAILMTLESEHANKIGRALEDAGDEVSKKSGANKDELGKALDRALGYAKSASAFAAAATKLAPHLRNAVAWLGGKWTALLTHLA